MLLAIWNNRQTTIHYISPELFPLIMVLGKSPPQPTLMRQISDIGWHFKILFLNGSASSHLYKRFLLKVFAMMEGIIMALVSVWIGAGGLRVKPHLTDELGDPKMLWVLKPVYFTGGFRPDALCSALRFRVTKERGIMSCIYHCQQREKQ